MRITPELLDEMSESFQPCGCNVCVLADENYAYLVAEMSWEESAL